MAPGCSGDSSGLSLLLTSHLCRAEDNTCTLCEGHWGAGIAGAWPAALSLSLLTIFNGSCAHLDG